MRPCSPNSRMFKLVEAASSADCVAERTAVDEHARAGSWEKDCLAASLSHGIRVK
jgi:hypothetical protein